MPKLKTWTHFLVSNAKNELSRRDKDIAVSSRGYMLGYNNLKDPFVSSFFRLLSKIGNKIMNIQIIRIDFGGRK